jgi:hypothetical protein
MLELSLEGKSPNENDLLLGYTVHMLKLSTLIVENLGYKRGRDFYHYRLQLLSYELNISATPYCSKR